MMRRWPPIASPRNCQGSSPSGSPCISARRSSSSARAARRSSGSPRWSRRCARRGSPCAQVDLGGGLTVPYGDETAGDAGRIRRDGARCLRPARCRAGVRAGPLSRRGGWRAVASVVYVKEGGRRIVVVDAAMNDLVRPAMYKAEHRILPVREPAVGARDDAGRRRRAGLRDDRHLYPRPRPAAADEGELVAFMTAGAYGAAMSSTYNTRPPGARGAGRRRSFCGDPARGRAMTICSRWTRFRIG